MQDKQNKENIPVLAMLQQLRDGALDPKQIDKDTRRQLVEVLYSEDYTIYQVAQIFNCSEKTIQRDLADIRKQNALVPSANFASEMIGELVSKARQHCSALGRISKSSNSTPQERILSSVSGWKIFKELVERLQSLGYLPSRPTEIVGDIFHHSENSAEETPEEMRRMLASIEELGKETNILDEEVIVKIESLKVRIAQTEIAQEIRHLEIETDKNMEEKK
jgi:hypothetical protein|tara:strand:+ start:4046 stop:4708 length:663 start_codon:yes stop_codon:yes gene_type:complete